MPEPTPGSVAALTSALLADQSAREALFQEWLGGVPTGGPQGDGRYPLPTPAGLQLVPCWAAICAPVTGPAAQAAQSATEALSAAEASQGAADSASASLASVEALAASLQTLLTQVTTLRQEAAAEHAAARAEREACQQLKDEVQALLDTINPSEPAS